jgi:hypothetical protein
MLPPLDSREIPTTFPDDLAAQITLARALRQSPAHCIAEGLLGLEDYGAEIFTDHALKVYISSRFGDGALERYVASLPQSGSMIEMAETDGWRATPLSFALASEDLVPGERFLYGPHFRIISNLIVRAIQGKGKKRLAFSLPFRHGKSVLGSIATPAWFMNNFPNLSCGICSATDSLSVGFNRQVRNILAARSEKFGFSLSTDSTSAHDFTTSLGGRCWQGSVGASIIGRGAELLVADDLIRGSEGGNSPTQLDAAWSWFTADFLPRSQNGGVILLIGTRWSENDIFGRLQSGYEGTVPSLWEFVSLPAIATTENGDLLGRKKGEALWPAKRPLSELETFRAGMSSEAWSLGFQQVPIEQTGIGKCCPNFDAALHVRESGFDPSLPIKVACDFNVDNFTVILAQHQEYIADRMRWLLCNERLQEITVLEEIVCNNQTTEGMADILIEKLRQYGKQVPGKLKVVFVGDAAGNQRKTSAASTAQTDWEILRQAFGKRTDVFQTKFDVHASNPSVKDTLDEVAMVLRNAAGHCLFHIDPRCRACIEDLRTCSWTRDAHGNPQPTIDKRIKERGHALDCIRYLVHSTAPRGAKAMYMRDVLR